MLIRNSYRWGIVKATKKKPAEKLHLSKTKDFTDLRAQDGKNAGSISSREDNAEMRQVREALAASEERYRLVIESSTDAVMLFDEKTRQYISVNAAACRMYGYTHEEFIGLNQSDITAQLDESEASIEETLSVGNIHIPLRYHRRKTGEIFPVEISGSTISVGERQILCGFIRDITERMQAEQASRDSEEKYRTLSLNVPGMIYQADAEWSVPTILNSELICGFSSDDFLAKKVDWLDLIHPDDKQIVIEEGSRITEKKMSIRQEYRIFDKEGNIRWVVDRKTSVFNDDGSFKGIYGVVYDITGRKLTQERSEFLAEILDSSPLSVIAIDRAVKITYVNPAAETLFGFKMEELLQQNPGMLFANLDSEDLRKDILDTILKRNTWYGELMVRKKSGEVFPVHTSIYGLLDAKGRLNSFVTFQENITDRKEIESELSRRASELKKLSGQLRKAQEEERAAIARELHDEFGQALTAIKIDIDRLENEFEDHHVTREAKERMRETGALADQLLKQVRDLALELRPSMLDDLGLSAALKWYVRGFAARTEIECDLQIAGQESPLSDIKRTVIYRAVQEALTNIARHAQAKSTGILLRFGTDILTVEVKDDGNGFDVDVVFGAQSERYAIGLWGMRESVEELGGTWRIQSKAGRGTHLTVSIPIEDLR